MKKYEIQAIDLDDEEGTDVMIEVEILARCKHPNIVQLYDAYTMGNRITVFLIFCVFCNFLMLKSSFFKEMIQQIQAMQW